MYSITSNVGDFDMQTIWLDNTSQPYSTGTISYPHTDCYDKWIKAKPIDWSKITINSIDEDIQILKLNYLRG